MDYPGTVKVVSPVSDDNKLGYIIMREEDVEPHHEIFGAPKKAAPKIAEKPVEKAEK